MIEIWVDERIPNRTGEKLYRKLKIMGPVTGRVGERITTLIPISTNNGIPGIYKDLSLITITSRGGGPA